MRSKPNFRTQNLMELQMKSKTTVTCCGQGTYIETEKENGNQERTP